MLDSVGPYVENKAAGERMETRVQGGAYAVKARVEPGEMGPIALYSCAGVRVLPEAWLRNVPHASEAGLASDVRREWDGYFQSRRKVIRFTFRLSPKAGSQ